MNIITVDSVDEVPYDYTGIAIHTVGYKVWYLNGKFHREDGPAIEWEDGTRRWYVEGELVAGEASRKFIHLDDCIMLDTNDETYNVLTENGPKKCIDGDYYLNKVSEKYPYFKNLKKVIDE